MKPFLIGLALLAALVGFSLLPSGGTPVPQAPPVVVQHPDDDRRLWEIRPIPTYGWEDDPPPVLLRTPEQDIELKAWTTCWSGPPRSFGRSVGYCADGAPAAPEKLPAVAGARAFDFWFGMPGWEFTATYNQLGTDCPHRWTVPAARVGKHQFRIDPAGPAGRYQVDLFGRGKQGDVAMSFVGETTIAGEVPAPTGYTAVLADHDGKLDSYGVELGLSGLAGRHEVATAQIRVTAANGRSTTLPVTRNEDATESGAGCYDAGSISFRAPDETGRRAAELGPAPFDYRVDLTLDGRKYVGTAVWPRDEDPDQAPGVPLTWSPDLPAYNVDH